jgi:putative ABC transport system ATP-binding protein
VTRPLPGALFGVPGLGRGRPAWSSPGPRAPAGVPASPPALILADEPTGNLDTQTSAEIMGLFTRLNAEQGLTVVIVTHEADVARYARRLVRFVDGRVVHDGAVTP